MTQIFILDSSHIQKILVSKENSVDGFDALIEEIKVLRSLFAYCTFHNPKSSWSYEPNRWGSSYWVIQENNRQRQFL